MKTLEHVPLHVAHEVREVVAPAHAPEWATWLADLGFVEGERVMVMAHGVPGHDPLVVRIGISTFALRRAEAACVRVQVCETESL